MQIRISGTRRHVHPTPAIGLHLLSHRHEPFLCQRLQQRCIRKEDAVLLVREQVAPHSAASLLVDLNAYELRQRIPTDINLFMREVIAQRLRAALPLRRLVEGGFLRRMVVGDGKGHQLFQRHGVSPVVGQQARRNVGELQAPLHHQGGDAEVGGNVLDGPSLGHQISESLELVGRVHGLALHILGQAHGARSRVGHQQAGHLEVLRELAALDPQLERGEAAATGDDFVVLAIGSQHDVEVLQQAHAGDAGSEFGNRRAAALAHVAARWPQLGQRNEQQFLRSRDGCDSSGDSGGFVKGSGVHSEISCPVPGR
ncbi:hypothetical protein D3C71_1107690 [compost metagenome]